MANFFVDMSIAPGIAQRWARPGELLPVNAHDPVDVHLPPARDCPGAEVLIVEVAGEEERTTVYAAPGDAIGPKSAPRASVAIGGPPLGPEQRYIRLMSDGAHEAIQAGGDQRSAPGSWSIVGSFGLIHDT